MSFCFQSGYLQVCFDGFFEGFQGFVQRSGVVFVDSTGRVLGIVRLLGFFRAYRVGCTRGDEEVFIRQDGVVGFVTYSRNRIFGSAFFLVVLGFIRETRVGEKFFQKVRFSFRVGFQFFLRALSGQGVLFRYVIFQEGVGAGGFVELCGIQGGVFWWLFRGFLGLVALFLLKMLN